MSKNTFLEGNNVIIAGGGVAGLSAAIACARGGTKTLLIERNNCLGGTATTGLVIEFSKTAGNKGGIFKELCERMENLGGLRWGRSGFELESVLAIFDPEVFKYVAQIMCEEAGVNLLFHTFIESACCENNIIKGITICNKSGHQIVDAKVVIDATGDADVCVSAGVPYETGDRKTGKIQSITLRPRIGGVVMKSEIDWVKIRTLFEQERIKGRVNFPWYVTKWLDAGAQGIHGERTFNLDMVTGVDATNIFQLSKAEIEGRKRVWEFVFFARKYIPGWEDCYLIDTAMHIGVRETRRIKGRYILREEDVRARRKFEDGISRASFGMDLHDVPEECSSGNKSGEEPDKKISCSVGDYYEIPYRCLVPEKIEGLLVAGRCISTDRRAGGSVRIMNTCMNTGQAAGVAASISVKENLFPSQLSGVRVRKVLIKLGADL